MYRHEVNCKESLVKIYLTRRFDYYTASHLLVIADAEIAISNQRSFFFLCLVSLHVSLITGR